MGSPLLRWIFCALVGVAALPGCEGEREGDDPGECADGADNDSDGHFDCDDQDCSGAPDCPRPDAPGCACDAIRGAPSDALAGGGWVLLGLLLAPSRRRRWGRSRRRSAPRPGPRRPFPLAAR